MSRLTGIAPIFVGHAHNSCQGTANIQNKYAIFVQIFLNDVPIWTTVKNVHRYVEDALKNVAKYKKQFETTHSKDWYSKVLVKRIMAKCTKCGADITSTGYDTEELQLPDSSIGYIVSCKQCKTIVGIVQEK